MEVILGAIASLLTEFLKKRFGTSEYKTLSVLLVVSLLAATVYTYLVAEGYWQSVLRILIDAGAFYTFILVRFKK